MHNQVCDPSANFLLLDMSIENSRLTLASSYGPNSDNTAFYQTISSKISEIGNETIIWCGDLNIVLNPEMDYCNYKTIKNKKARETLIEIIQEKFLLGPFRDLHPNIRRYTWQRNNPFQPDLISSLNYVDSCKIENSYRTDHSPVTLSLKFTKFIKGKPMWKQQLSTK